MMITVGGTKQNFKIKNSKIILLRGKVYNVTYKTCKYELLRKERESFVGLSIKEVVKKSTDKLNSLEMPATFFKKPLFEHSFV